MAVGWGLISLGRHSDVKLAPALNQASDARFVAAYSRDLATAEAFAEKHGADSAYDSLDAILADPNVDAVFIASPNFLHAEHTIAAARAGKHVLAEKPMATSVSEASEMVAECERHGVQLGVGFQLRFHPGHIKARELLDRQALGAVSLVQGQWCLGQRGVVNPPARTGRSQWWGDPRMIGGASTLMGTGVHVIDILQWMTGQDIVEVAALTDGQTEERPLEQAASIAIRFEDGTMGSITVGRRVPESENDAMIYGSQGRIALRGTLWEACTGSLEVETETVHISESYDDGLQELYKLQIEAFNRAVQGGDGFRASGLDGLRVVEVTSAIIESAATRRAVRVERAAL
ncbi:MAG: Gfo/Idh/MocA family oxidoreductase [Chloroflexi bacterium]|nr:Gfo/Idh/MocA family oxidoreductase [Chloroflexota bacterium]